MAEVKKKKLKSFSKHSKKISSENKESRKLKNKVSLSKEKFVPSSRLEDYVKVIYGDIGVGKTTLALEQPGSYALMFDQNRSYECFQTLMRSWQDFLDLQGELLTTEHQFTNVIFDGLQIAYEMCMDYGCGILNIDHPGGMNDYGATWSKIKKFFIVPIRELVQSGIGVTFVCHSKEMEIETRVGRKFVMLVPDLSKQARETIVAPWDNVFYYHYAENGKRYLQIVGDDYIEAKNRMRGHFIAKDGKPVFKIPMGSNEKEAYQNIIDAFNNKQLESLQPVEVDKVERRKPLKKLKKSKAK